MKLAMENVYWSQSLPYNPPIIVFSWKITHDFRRLSHISSKIWIKSPPDHRVQTPSGTTLGLAEVAEETGGEEDEKDDDESHDKTSI